MRRPPALSGGPVNTAAVTGDQEQRGDPARSVPRGETGSPPVSLVSAGPLYGRRISGGSLCGPGDRPWDRRDISRQNQKELYFGK